MTDRDYYQADRLEGIYPAFQVELTPDLANYIEMLLSVSDQVLLEDARQQGDPLGRQLYQAKEDIMGLLTGKLSLDGDFDAYTRRFAEIFPEEAQNDQAAMLIHKSQAVDILRQFYRLSDEQITPDLAMIASDRDLYDFGTALVGPGPDTIEDNVKYTGYISALYFGHSEKAQGDSSILRQLRDKIVDGSFDRFIMQDALEENDGGLTANTRQALGLIQRANSEISRQEAIEILTSELAMSKDGLFEGVAIEYAKMRTAVLANLDYLLQQLSAKYDKLIEGRSEHYDDAINEAVQRYEDSRRALEQKATQQNGGAKKRGRQVTQIVAPDTPVAPSEVENSVEPRPVSQYILGKNGMETTTTLEKALEGHANSKDLQGAIQYIATYFDRKIGGRPMNNGIAQLTDVAIGRNGNSRPVYRLNPNNAAVLGRWANKRNIRPNRVLFAVEPDADQERGAIQVIAIVKREKEQDDVVRQIRYAQATSH